MLLWGHWADINIKYVSGVFIHAYAVKCVLIFHLLHPGCTSSAKEWSRKWTTSSLPSQQSMPNVASNGIRYCSAALAPAPNTSAFAPAGTIRTDRWHCAGTAYDQRRARRIEKRVMQREWLCSLTSDLGLAAKQGLSVDNLSGNCMIVLWVWWLRSLSLQVHMVAVGPQSLQNYDKTC